MSENTPDYKLSKGQEKFVRAAERWGLIVYYNYVGRYTFNARCPAVWVKSPKDFRTKLDVSAEYDYVKQMWAVYLCI